MRIKARITKTFEIYSASAGSGKTYQLTKIYLSLLLKKNSFRLYRQLLAITFTNKAVGEMKERILNNLYNFSLEDIPDQSKPLFNELLDELSLEPKQLQEKSQSILKELLHNYAFFEVSTIDRFNHKLIRTFAQDLKIAQNFEVVLNTDVLLEEAIARLLSSAGTHNELTKVLMDFTFDKISDDKSWNISYDLADIGKLIFQENHYEHLSRLKEKNLYDFLGLKSILQSKIAALQKKMQGCADKVLDIIASNGLEFSDFYSGYFPKFMKTLSEGSSNINFGAGWKQDFENARLYGKNSPSASLIESLRPKFTTIFKTIKSDFEEASFFRNALKNVIPLALLNEITKQIEALKQERNLLPISEFNTIISKEIKNQPIPFIYERLGEKYRHYFIDEFQDTSLMQWQNLVPLIGNALEGENELGEKGSLLLVGDVKQAIYRWRGGRAEQFLNLINLNSNPFSVSANVVSMASNWRSHTEIVNFNNSFFRHAAKALQNKQHRELYEIGSKQKIQNKQTGCVELIFVENAKDAEADPYCEQTLQLIQSVLEKGYDYKDICILVRKNKYGVTLANHLAHHNIPIVSSESLLLKENPKILFLVAFLRYFHDESDQYAFYMVLSSLAPKKNHHEFISAYLNAPRKFYSDFEIDSESLKKSTTYNIVEWLVAKFSLSSGSEAFVHQFLEMVFEVEKKDGTGIYQVLQHWEANVHKLSITAPEHMNAVKIMTVHKAKGLEFPVVIFPYADSKIIDSRNKKIWIDIEEEDLAAFDELLFDYGKLLGEREGRAKNVYQTEQENLALDAFNVLYVAMTRAISALFVITAKIDEKKALQNDSYSALFIDYLKHLAMYDQTKSAYRFGHLLPPDKKQKEHSLSEEVSFESFSTQLPNSVSKASGSFESEATRFGELFHNFMSKIDDKHDAEQAIDALKSGNALSLEEENFLRSSYLKIISHPEINGYFKTVGHVYNEKDILHPELGILRPDRIVVEQDKATLIDYKTGQKSPAHKQQMQRYASALVDMGFEIDKNVLIYFSSKNIEPVIF
ncbi:UvrD-helicase domain-containing protein [Allomuricauda sp. d1]|uniref:UvrD-helicase domain-containing protein n=1 Tax=Allomuricauda sp. d1 TaxID=3136725 RepID=UPI0031D53224